METVDYMGSLENKSTDGHKESYKAAGMEDSWKDKQQESITHCENSFRDEIVKKPKISRSNA